MARNAPVRPAAAILLGIIGVVLLWASLAAHATPWIDHEGPDAPRVHLHFFWTEACLHCQRALPFVRDLAREHPWLVVHEGQLGGDPDALRRYVDLAAELGQEARSVPAFVACGELRVGYEDDASSGALLEAWLVACRDAARRGDTADRAPSPPPADLPLLGEVDVETLPLPLLTLLFAALDAFNPCAFFVLLVLLSLMVHSGSRARMLLVGGTFVLFSGLLYFLFMSAWLNLFLLLGSQRSVTLAAGTIALLIGLFNSRDALRPGAAATLAIPEQAKPRLYRRVRGLLAAGALPALLGGTVLLALAANSYELLCTAGFPMVYTRLLTLHDLAPGLRYAYLALYNVVYVLPLLTIVALVATTLGSHRLGALQGRRLKLLSGLMMLGLGTILLLEPAWLASPWTGVGLVVAALLTSVLAVRRTDERSL
jgi:hypothetical protein